MVHVVIIRGVFARGSQFSELCALLPEASVAIRDLPTMDSPSVTAFVDFWDYEIRKIPGPVVVCGSSLGGTVALALKAPNLRGVVALDPPMVSADLENLRPRLGHLVGQTPRGPFLHGVFGWGENDTAARDWFPLLADRQCLATVLFGDGGRPSETPTVLTDASARRLADHPLIRVARIPGVGHNMMKGARTYIVAAIRMLLSNRDQNDKNSAGTTGT